MVAEQEQKYTVKSVIELLKEKFPGVELPSIDSIPESILNRQVSPPQFPKSTLSSNQISFEEYKSFLPPEAANYISIPPIQNIIVGTEKPDTLIGTKLNDLMRGFGGDDLFFALDGDDIILGDDGNDIAFGGAGNDIISLDNGDDFAFGESGKDLFIASQGNDSFFGGDETDTAYYADFGGAITLQATGIVNKGNAGIDQLSEIETIVGAKGEVNIIDASDGGSLSSIDVNLNKNFLNVTIVNRPSLSFTVENFVNVRGTSQADNIIGDNNNNLLLGEGGNDNVNGGKGNDILSGGSKISKLIPPEDSVVSTRFDGNDIVNGESGNDIVRGGTGFDNLDGGSGIDTVDYRFLGQAITLKPAGEIDKGTAGVDQIRNFETIVGAKGKANTIDGSTVTNGTTLLNVDLSADQLTVKNVPGVGNLNFTVKEFVNVTGTSQNDDITGNSNNNILVGGEGDDFASGGGGKDTLIGVNQNFASPGFNETDVLLGGADSDIFVLGDAKNAYYFGNGSNDKALLTDFRTGEDFIQLNGTINDYVIQDSNTQNLSLGASSTNIYRRQIFTESADSLTSSIVSPGDLIAVVNGTVAKSDLLFISDKVDVVG
ncbi:MAG: calcium-binding protein [Nostocaceae cyanobacterium]|nr:calcium-binding protein [Nostocaceae cyanobacterium]